MLWPPDAVLDLELLPTEHGGRSLPTPDTFLGCPFVFEGELFDCRLDFSDIGPLNPGARARVPVVFLSPALIVPRLRRGSSFTIWEGRPIGQGAVVEVVAQLGD